METALIIGALIIAVIMAMAALATEKLKSRQLKELKEHARKAEIEAAKQTKEALADADIGTTVGFLNRLHKD